ncbi:MAG TPA: alpha-amylase family glycosyl hydrolase [Acidimicrobiales bacterium]|nr:alpha-amylase family glycosyl hydrolase [Acidimicrobiales bacterium]
MAAPWWKSAVIYQIYPRSFADSALRSDGVAVGDLEGIRRRLDHLVWLGVDALWLSPVYRSPMADFGYDVSDHCDIDPLFGTLDDFDRLLDDAHGRGLRVILDWVPNHTSDRHPWFVESRSSRDDPRRHWYVWRDPAPGGGPPNNWRAAFADVPAWTFDEATGQYYLHLFLPEQPDLNWSEPGVVEAMHDVLRFWLDRGVDGFRADVVHAIGKDPALPDDPPEAALLPKSSTNDHHTTHALLRDIRAVLDGYPGDRMMVGEVYLLDTAQVATYYGAGDELHLAFNFPPLYTPWDAALWRERLDEVDRHVGPVGGWPTWVLSNHDNPRHRTRYGSEARARAAAVLLLTLRGTPFLYAGEELGLEDAQVPPERMVDPGGRDGCRAPIPWEPGPGHGWHGEPWLPWPPDPEQRNAATLGHEDRSIVHLYRRLLGARRASPALSLGHLQLVSSPDGVLAWTRQADGDRRTVAVNFTETGQALSLDGSWQVELSSDGASGVTWSGRLAPNQAVVLRPA